MAVLTTGERAETGGAIQRWWSALRESCAFSKPELSAAVNAADVWADANAAAYNTALPVAFRTSATAVQKTLLLVYVLLRRVKRDGVAIPMPGEV